MARQKFDHEGLKREFLAGNCQTLTEFFDGRGISPNTYKYFTEGWLDEKKRIAIKAAEKVVDRKASALAAKFRAGRVLVAKSMRQFAKADLSDTNPKSLAEIIKIGAELQKEIVENPATQVNVQVNNEFRGVSPEQLKQLGDLLS